MCVYTQMLWSWFHVHQVFVLYHTVEKSKGEVEPPSRSFAAEVERHFRVVQLLQIRRLSHNYSHQLWLQTWPVTLRAALGNQLDAQTRILRGVPGQQCRRLIPWGRAGWSSAGRSLRGNRSTSSGCCQGSLAGGWKEWGQSCRALRVALSPCRV